MKKQSNVAYILRICLTLLIITAVMAAALAGVNAITVDKISAATAEKTRAAISEVLVGVGDVESVEFSDETGLVRTVYQGTVAAGTAYAVEVAPAGFGGEITLMVGIDPEGKVAGISVISQTETAGLGAVAAADTAKGRAFRSQFTGLTGTLAVSKDGGEVDALTGATITSRAVVEGVNAALACVAARKGG